jgi:hypothetical protein
MTQPTNAQGKLLDKSNNPQLQDQQAAVADITVTGNYATDDTPIETAINGILATLRLHGLIAD